MTVFFTSSRFQEFCMSYYQLSFGSKCLLEVHVQLSWSIRYHHVKFYATVS